MSLVTLAGALALGGCPSDASVPNSNGGTGGVGGFGGAAGFSGVGGGGGFMPAGGTGGSVLTGGTGGSGGGGGGRASIGGTALPCDVTDVLKNRCQSCHGSTPLAGVPMALMSWEDFDAPAVSNPSLKVRDVVKTRIHDPVAPMPPTSTMPTEDRTLLDAWVDGGGLAGTDPTCAPVIDNGPKYEGEIPPFADNCYEVRAHPNGQPGEKLTVSGETYGNFYFDAPWPEGAQGVYFETLPGDNPEILHHWLIYAEENGNQPDGYVDYPGLGTHPSAPTLVAGWAPGADNNDIPSDVGLKLDAANRKMSMEIHFFPQPGQTYQTNAGVKICTVETPEKIRPNTATISWLGTELGIQIPPGAVNNEATGTCTPQWADLQAKGINEIHILRSWPHMHLLGKKMRSTIVRANGMEEPMHPGDGWPFDFDNEVSHKTEFVLYPGDTVRTTCVYDNDTLNYVAVGFETRYEMCFNFTTAYPANALVSPGSSLTGSATGCLY